MADSAINSSTKRTILTQECLRRLRNTKIELGEEIRNEHLTKFMLKMKNSGHKVNFRTRILKSSLNAFEKMVEEDKSGKKPLHRNRSWNKENRTKDKENKKNNWYKIDKNSEKSEKQFTSILFVPPTPGSELLKDIKKRDEELNKNEKDRINFFEKGCIKIEKLLTNKKPFKTEKWTDKWCPLCKGEYGEIKIDCNTNNAGYRWVCKTCEKNRNQKRVYEGETSRSIRIRTLEHLRGLKNKISSNVLYKHSKMDHIGENVEFGLEISGTFNNALTRQANESIRIYKRPDSELLNSKSEFNHPPTARVMLETKRDYKSKSNQHIF